MEARKLDIDSLFKKALAGDNKAFDLFLDHLIQNQVTEQKKMLMQLALQSEIAKPDAVCNSMALVLYGYFIDDITLEIQLLDRAIALGNTEAMCERADMHKAGVGGPVDHAAAIILYDRAIDLGNSRAMNSRGCMHQAEEGGPVDYVAAIALYDRAIPLGDPYAMFNRAMRYIRGEVEERNYPPAIALLERAIALGHPSSMVVRAHLYRRGEGGPEEPLKAARLYRQAALNGKTRNIRDGMTFLFTRSSDIHVLYHLHMICFIAQDQIPSEVFTLFTSYPDAVADFMLSDDLLSPEKKQQVVDFVGQHYLDRANSEFINAEIADIQLLLSKIPESTSYYHQILSIGADALYNRLIEGEMEEQDLLSVLISVDAIHREILQHELTQLTKTDLAALKDDEPFVSRMEQLDILLASTKPVLELTSGLTQKNLMRYIERRNEMDNYAFSLREFLKAVYAKLTAQETFPLRLWQKPFLYHLRLIRNELKQNDPLPSGTLETIQLAARIYTHLQADPSNEARTLVKIFPAFSTSLQRGVKRKHYASTNS